MKLLYINALNKNHKGESIYEFLFGQTTEIEYGENWEQVPASAASVTPPPIDYVHEVGLLVTDEMEIDCVQFSDFAVVDAVDTIIALGWEDIPLDGIVRLVFHFGESLESVKDKLYSRDLTLNMEINNKYSTDNE